jgi:hypothetical protein
MSNRAPFGWTVVRNGDSAARIPYRVYLRDCPADAAHNAADLAPFTFATKEAAVAAGKRGEFAYRR